MHIETLKTFCDLVDTGSFSKAAQFNWFQGKSFSAIANSGNTEAANDAFQLIFKLIPHH
jgi:hypothetical protein